ncbi:MAG: lipocalin-like domain-containing protein [Chthoniobacterales bacterium]
MKRFSTKAALLLFASVALAADGSPSWQAALPGWRYEFPRDHHAHPGFKTEWWYLTGNLESDDGRRFGFQLTFFRQGVRRGAAGSRFAVEDIKLAHFAVTDIENGRFHHAQKVSRGAFGEAGFSDGDRLAWIDEWELVTLGEGRFRIAAREKEFALALDLAAGKPPVFHGEDGVSQKSAGEGRASHYYSFTRLEARGTLELQGRAMAVRGLAWFDQEWATNQLAADQSGWDWFSLQFEDGGELMLFQIRSKGGGCDPFSHGTWIDAEGCATPVQAGDFELKPGRLWQSAETGGAYPVEWQVRIPKLGLDVAVAAAVDAQELVLRPISYWEGSVVARGTREGTATAARGYLEMTGYAGGLVGLQAPGQR